MRTVFFIVFAVMALFITPASAYEEAPKQSADIPQCVGVQNLAPGDYNAGLSGVWNVHYGSGVYSTGLPLPFPIFKSMDPDKLKIVHDGNALSLESLEKENRDHQVQLSWARASETSDDGFTSDTREAVREYREMSIDWIAEGLEPMAPAQCRFALDDDAYLIGKVSYGGPSGEISRVAMSFTITFIVRPDDLFNMRGILSVVGIADGLPFTAWRGIQFKRLSLTQGENAKANEGEAEEEIQD